MNNAGICFIPKKISKFRTLVKCQVLNPLRGNVQISATARRKEREERRSAVTYSKIQRFKTKVQRFTTVQDPKTTHGKL